MLDSLSLFIPFLSAIAALAGFSLFAIKRMFSQLEKDIRTFGHRLDNVNTDMANYERRMHSLMDEHMTLHMAMKDDILSCKNRLNQLESRNDGLAERVSALERAGRRRTTA